MTERFKRIIGEAGNDNEPKDLVPVDPDPVQLEISAMYHHGLDTFGNFLRRYFKNSDKRNRVGVLKEEMELVMESVNKDLLKNEDYRDLAKKLLVVKKRYDDLGENVKENTELKSLYDELNGEISTLAAMYSLESKANNKKTIEEIIADWSKEVQNPGPEEK